MPAERSERAGTLARVCGALARDARDEARAIALAEYPFTQHANAGRAYTELQSMRLFLRDRFTDRYSGTRLVFPGTLRLLSKVLPEEFPAHPNWKMSESHIAYYELFPSIDHVVPVARGGTDSEANWVTTSMLRNSAKSNWTLEELGWSLHEPATDDWDGLVGWCSTYLARHPQYLEDKCIKRWHRAAALSLEAKQA
jgi:5-methylcytosine-specific restriction endonuclease McrA